MGISKPPINFRKKQNEMEYIEQHHFVKKSEKKAITKHEPKEEPKFGQKDSFSIGDNTFHYTEPETPITSSYNPYTFQTNPSTPYDPIMSYSFKSVEEAIQNGKDTDIVAMSVGEVRSMEERIRLLEKQVMKSKSVTASSAFDKHQKIQLELENRMAQHQLETERNRIKIQAELSKFDKLFDK